jgi:hypothetical protein
MPSYDATDPLNQAIWQALSGDLQLGAFYVSLFGAQGAPNGGAWNLQADDGTPTPFLVFRSIMPGYDYTFGPDGTPPAVEHYPYTVTAWAEDRDGGMTGEQICATLVAHARRILSDAALAVAGYTLLVCRPVGGVPMSYSQGPQGRDQISQGVRFEIAVTQ